MLNANPYHPRRQIRLTNEKIAAAITHVPGAKEAMVEMGWKEEGDCLVLPAGKTMTMREVNK
jgi:hypothetical protein